MDSTEIADFFCDLYDRYVDDRATLLVLSDLRSRTRHLRNHVRDLICAGLYDVAMARRSVDADKSQATGLAHMWGIDAAFERINPYRATDPPSVLSQSVQLHAREQRFSSDHVDGALIARSQSSGRPNQEEAVFADAFSALLRVSEASWEGTVRVVLPLTSQLSLGELDGALRVASAAVIEHPHEMTWEAEQRNGIWYYRISIIDNEVEARQGEVVRGLHAHNCHIGLLPELSCSPALLDSWRQCLADEISSSSPLRWLLAGTGNLDRRNRPVNAGVLLDAATADDLMRHDKMYAFTLTKEQLERWALPLPGDHDLDEDIARGETLQLAQTGVGWLGILICQDLAELHMLDDPLIEHGVRWLFVPVFSEATAWQHWEHQKAKHYATEAGTSTVVSNSLVVSRCQGHLGPMETALACGPDGAVDNQSASATDITGFRLSEAGITRT